MFAAIERARRHVHLETYILRTDRLGRRMLDALAARSRAGVEVRVIFDALGSRGIDRRVLSRFAMQGIEFAEFNPPSRWFWRFRPRRRDHRKLLLVDGQVGFLGGLNIGDEYVDGSSGGRRWRDAHLRLEGPAMTELEALFVENWFRCGGSSFDWHALVATEPEAGGEHALAIVPDGPTYPRRRMRDVFLDELARAREQVLLVSPYFAPGRRVLDALGQAGERGVEIDLVLAGQTDHPLLRRAARVVVPSLMRRGVRVYEDRRAMMHAKLAAFDDRVAVVGTSNLDRQSLRHSCEVNAVIEGPETTKWVREHFSPDVLDLERLEEPSAGYPTPIRKLADRWATFWADL